MKRHDECNAITVLLRAFLSPVSPISFPVAVSLHYRPAYTRVRLSVATYITIRRYIAFLFPRASRCPYPSNLTVELSFLSPRLPVSGFRASLRIGLPAVRLLPIATLDWERDAVWPNCSLARADYVSSALLRPSRRARGTRIVPCLRVPQLTLILPKLIPALRNTRCPDKTYTQREWFPWI